MDRKAAESKTILRAVIGSTVHGLNLEGSDDLDEMGVLIEDLPDQVCLGQSFEQFIYRSAAERDGYHDAPSKPGDLDLTLYSLRKFCRLAANGNPTIINLLFVPHEYHRGCYAVGHQLQEMAHLFISKEAASHYMGYMQAQHQRLLGLRGQKRIKRPELEEKYGYDTKYAMHMLRLGYQGVEVLTTGRIQFPMEPESRSFLMMVRRGEVDLQTVQTKAGELEAQLKDLKETAPVQDHPDRPQIETWMQDTYFQAWKAREIRHEI